MMLNKRSKLSSMNPARESTGSSEVDRLWAIAEAAEFLQLISRLYIPLSI